MAVVDVPPEQTQALGTAAAEEDAILAVEPERVVYALQDYSPGSAVLPTLPSEVDSAPRLPVNTYGGIEQRSTTW